MQTVSPGINYYEPSEAPSFPGGIFEYVGQDTYYAPAPVDMWLINGQWIQNQPQAPQASQAPQFVQQPQQQQPIQQQNWGQYQNQQPIMPQPQPQPQQPRTIILDPPGAGMGYARPPVAARVLSPQQNTISAPNRVGVGNPIGSGKVYVAKPTQQSSAPDPYGGFKPGSWSNRLNSVDADNLMRAYLSAHPADRARLVAMISQSGTLDEQLLSRLLESGRSQFKFSESFYNRPVIEIR